jgi:cell division septation protein DedD
MYLFNEDLFRKSLGIESLNTKKHNIEKNKPGIKKSVSQPKPLDSLKSVQTDAQKAPGSNSANQPNQLTGTEAKGRDVNNVSGPMQEPARTMATAPERKTQDNKPAIAMNVPKTQAHPVYHNKPESKPGSNGKTEFKPESKDKPFASKIEKPKPDIKTGTNNNAAKPNTANKKNLAMASTAKTNSETNSQKTASTEKVKEVYTVQVYSTPSREDAEEWLRRLQAKNIRDAFISPQRVRDDVWYRVRFGAYESREEARSAALRLGFSQSWIDRVR